MNKFIKFCYCILLGIFTFIIVLALISAFVEVFTH